MKRDTEYTQAESVFLLDCLEFASRIMRGPDRPLCEGLMPEGLQALLASPEAMTVGLKEALCMVWKSTPAKPHGNSTGKKAMDMEQLGQRYVSLFVTAQGGAPALPYASCHAAEYPPRMMGPAAMAMATRLGNAGICVQAVGLEPPDHLATQLEYLYFLLHAQRLGGARTPESAASFAAGEMLPWVRRFAVAVQSHDKGFFAALTVFLLKLLELVAADNN